MIAMHSFKRLDSLDALRGFDMMFIMGVSALIIATCSLFPGGENSWLALQMHHAKWDGFFHHDTIFPLFLFLAGVSFPFSYAGQQERGMTKAGTYRKILIRGLALFLLGLVYNGLFKLDFAQLRIFSVLGRIGFAWMFAALLFINFNQYVRAAISLCILFGYWFLCMIPAPDAALADPLSMEGCLAGYVDRSLFPGHLHLEKFDPEGLLGVLPATVTAMLGMFTGELVRKDGITGNKKTLIMIASATIMLAVCLIWKNWLPINKSLWSSTFVLAAGSYSLYLFAAFYWIIDVKGWRKWCFPLKVIGMNSIIIYLIPKFINLSYTRDFFLGGIIDKFGSPLTEIISAFGFVAVFWLLAFFLYKKEIFLKV